VRCSDSKLSFTHFLELKIGAYTAADWEATTRSQAEFHSAQLMQAAALTRANYLKMRADERKRNAQEIEIEEDLNYVNDAGGSRS